MRALIVDDERLARKELMKLLEDHPSIEVVGEAMIGLLLLSLHVCLPLFGKCLVDDCT